MAKWGETVVAQLTPRVPGTAGALHGGKQHAGAAELGSPQLSSIRRGAQLWVPAGAEIFRTRIG